MATLKQIPCPYCDGTGKRLNEFDPPVDIFRDTGDVQTINGKQRSFSGKEILNEQCPNCNGSLYVYKI